jgi:hypothetical protein
MSEAEPLKLSPAQRQVAGVLAEVHDATIVEITAVAGVSKSTVTKTLTMLEAAGAAERTIHTDGDVRLADTWSPTALTGHALMATSTADGPGYGHAEKLLTEARSDTAPVDELHAPGGSSSSDDDAPVWTEKLPDEPSITEPETVFAIDAGTARERLAPGGLAQLVANTLATHPFTEYTPTMLSHLLGGRSSGAISNALERQVKTGSAHRVSDKPRRYRHADTGSDI